MNPFKRLGVWGKIALGWLPEAEPKGASPVKPVPAGDKVIAKQGMFHGPGEAEPERYLFGLESPSIRKGRVDILPCGVHATNKRIFLVRSSPGMQTLVVGTWVGALVLSLSALAALIYLAVTRSIEAATAVGFPLGESGLLFLVIFLVIQRHRNPSPVSIQELERREIYEINKAEISSVEMKGSDLWGSRIKIHLKSGQSQSMLFSERRVFEHVMIMFPEPATKG